jgi:hypothetical protein
VTGVLRYLVARHRDVSGCRLPGRREGDDPCELCRLTDEVLSNVVKPLPWTTDESIVADLGTHVVSIEGLAGGQWRWHIESAEGWQETLVASGTSPTLAEAMFAAEQAAKGIK